jgi:hypothetical protein
MFSAPLEAPECVCNSDKNWAIILGFSPNLAAHGPLFPADQGTVAKIKSSFGITLAQEAIDGHPVHGHASDYKPPEELEGLLTSVTCLDIRALPQTHL